MTARLKAFRQHRINLVRRYKEYKGCYDCGGRFPHYILQLDHIDDTKKTRNNRRQCSFRDLSKPALKAELGQCDVVCMNCHGRRSYNRDQQRMKHNEL